MHNTFSNLSPLFAEVQSQLLNAFTKEEGFIIINTKREFLFVSEVFATRLGFDVKEIMGQKDPILYVELQNEVIVTDRENQITKSNNEEKEIIALRKKNGEIFWSQVTRIPLQLAENKEKLFLEIHKDVTELYLKIQENEKQRQIAQEAARFSILGQMIGGIAHEINNPLTVILGTAKYFKILCDKKELNLEVIEKGASKIMDATNRVAKVIKGIKSLSRNGSEDPLAECSADQLFESINTLIGTRVRNHGILFDIEIRSKEEPIICRQFELIQAIINLIFNSDVAIRVTGESKSKEDQPWIKLIFESDKDWMYFRVTDSGNGLKKEDLLKMKETFFTTKELGMGMGLGLGLVLSIVQNHKGEFFLDETSPTTSFVIKIPKMQLPDECEVRDQQL